MLDKHTDSTLAYSQPTTNQANKKVYARTGLGVIEVCGKDAAKLLQGQVTCNINDLSESQASIAAFCNAKGRVISTLLIVKQPKSYVLALPCELLDLVLKKLRMYVLRADVQLYDRSEQMQILGVSVFPGLPPAIEPPPHDFAVVSLPVPAIKLPGTERYLLMDEANAIQEFSQRLIDTQGYENGTLDEWRDQDIASALPWFGLNQTEQHIPQMLGIDQLGGVSFNKGCYTGQEIVARSHYLGKVKRALFVAECKQPASDDIDGCRVLDPSSDQALGCVLTHSTWSGITRLLLVLQIVDGPLKNPILDNDYRTPVAITSDL